jgi:hypothetical protein
MIRSFVLGGAGLLLMATAAPAQVTGYVTSRTLSYLESTGDYGQYNGPVSTGAAQYYADVFGSANYNNYQVSTTIDNSTGYIDFANNGTSSGFGDSLTTTTVIQVNFKNDTNSAVNTTLDSTIIPGGFGFYVGNLAGNPTLQDPGFNTDLNQAPLASDVNQTPEVSQGSFFDVDSYNPSPWNIGNASFSFKILSGSTVVASYTASLALYLTGPPGAAPTGVDPVLTDSFSTPLTNFGAISVDDPTKAVGYQWDATNISVPLGELAAGASTSLTYETSVTTDSESPGVPAFGYDLIAYAGFGDPIRKSAGTGTDPYFPLLELDAPTFDAATGELSAGAFQAYAPAQLPLDDIDLTAPAPEPGTWMLMLAGVGLVGSTLRRRRSRPAFRQI